MIWETREEISTDGSGTRWIVSPAVEQDGGALYGGVCNA